MLFGWLVGIVCLTRTGQMCERKSSFRVVLRGRGNRAEIVQDYGVRLGISYGGTGQGREID